MTTEHKLAWALRAAADDKNARFECTKLDGGYPIEFVFGHQHHDWQLVKKPVVKHAYYWRDECGDYLLTTGDWNMHITLIDGVPHKEVEFR